ncbi:MAG: PxKF domain-containing protein [Actinomycetota bacterium]
MKLIDGIGVKLIDGIGVKLIDGIGVKLIDGIGVKLIDGIGVKLIDGIGTQTEDAAVAVTLRAISLDGLRSVVGDPIENKFTGTIFEGQPSQSLTLYNYFWCINRIDSCRRSDASDSAATIKDRLIKTSLFGIDFSGTRLADLNFISILTANIPIKNIPGPNYRDGLEKQGFAYDPDATLVQLQLRGVNLAPFFATTQPAGGTSLNGVSLGAITLKDASGTPVNPLLNRIRLEFIDMFHESFGKIALKDIPLATRGSVVDCATYDCSTKTLYDAQRDRKADGTNFLSDTGLVGDLGSAVSSYALGDFALSLVSALGQEQLPYEVYAAGYENPALGTTKVTQTFTHAPVGIADVNPIVKVTLPAYWSYVTGSAQINVLGQRDPSVTASSKSTVLTWDFENLNIPAGQLFQITYQVRPWLAVGLTTSSATITTAAINERIDKRAPVQVTPSNEANGTPEQACTHPIQTGFAYFSQIERRGDRDFFCIPAPPVNSTINLSLRNVGSNNELVLYHPKDGDRPEPLSNLTVAEPAIQAAPDPAPGTALSGEPVAPDTHNEIQLENLPIAGISDNKGLAPESIVARTWSTHGTGPQYYIAQVSGAVGDGGADFSDLPYTLSFSITAPPSAISCPSRALTAAAPPTPSIAPTALDMQGKKTLFVVNRQRLYGEFGLAGGNDAMTALTTFASSPAGQAVGAAVFPIDAFSDVTNAYTNWDAAPCNIDAMREVPRAINRAITSVTLPMQIENLALIGSPIQVPYGATEDRTQVAKESSFAAGLINAAGSVDMAAAIADGNILTDSVYLGRAVPWGGDWLYLPTASVGRVSTEKASDIPDAINRLTANASWEPTASLATGYSFFGDVGSSVDSIFHAQRPAATQSTLLTETWTGDDLRQKVSALASTKTFSSINAHFSPFVMQPAGATSADDLYTPQKLLDGLSLNLWGYGTVGCHSLLSVPNSYVSANNVAKVTDWVEKFTTQGALWGAGQTTFGLGINGSTALTEKLLVDFASYLDGRMNVGQARASAIWDYYAQSGSFSEYDRKAMMGFGQTGFSFIKVGSGNSVTPPPTVPLTTDPITGLKVATFSADYTSPSVWNKKTTSTGSYYELNGRSQSSPGLPTQPLAIFGANSGVPGLRLHGVQFVPKQSSVEVGVNPSQGGVDVTAGTASVEPQSQITFPAAPAQVHRADTGDEVTFIAGRFRPNASLSGGQVVGEQTRWLNSQLIASLSTSSDFTPPVLSSIIATQLDPNDPSSVTFVGTTPSVDVARVVISYLKKNSVGDWKSVNAKKVGGTWVASPAAGDEVQEFFTQLQDTSGNWGLNTNQGDFHKKILPQVDAKGAVDINIQGTPGRNGWYVSPLTIGISSPSSGIGFETSINGGDFAELSTINLSSSGIYVIDFRASDRSAAGTIVVRLDFDDPNASITSPGDASVFELGTKGKTITFTCADVTSGIDTCEGTGPQGAVKSGDALYTDAPGEYTINVVATDFAGRQASAVAHYTVVDTTKPGITIVNPFDGETFLLNQTAGTAADYFCSDSGLIATCLGTAKKPDGSSVAVADGANLPTGQAGRYTFTVNSSDSMGNTSSRSHLYNVGYNFTYLDPPITKNKTNAGQQIPISWKIFDANGTSILDRSTILYLASYQIDPISGERRSLDESYPVSAVKLSDRYSFGWSTKSAWAGTSRVFYIRTKDLVEHPLTFEFVR